MSSATLQWLHQWCHHPGYEMKACCMWQSCNTFKSGKFLLSMESPQNYNHLLVWMPSTLRNSLSENHILCYKISWYFHSQCINTCTIMPAKINHLSAKKSLIFCFSLISTYLYYHNKIFITTAEFNGLSSATCRNEILHSEWKILVKI